jgi:2'-5' RNA ligase
VLIIAALLPPPDVLERVRSVVTGVTLASQEPAGRGRRGLLRRRAPVAPSPPPPMLDVRPAPAMYLPIARFGNLALGDVSRLVDAMEGEAREWATPRLSLSGGVAPEAEGDDEVYIKLAGDLDALGVVTRGITKVAADRQLYVDRRRFRPHVEVGRVNDHTTPAYLGALVEALDQFESTSWWMTHVSLVTPTDLGPGRAPFKTYREIPLGPTVTH